VLFYLFYKKENLVATMLHGKRRFPGGQPASVTTTSWLRFGVGLLLAGVLTWMVSRAFQFG